MDKTREFYIKDVFLYILKKWKSILICMLVFAVLADGYSALKSYKSVTDSQKVINFEETDVSLYTEGLTLENIKKVDETYELYLVYKESLDDLMSYYKNSLKMKIDPNNVPTVYLQYRISGADDISDIVTAFSNGILSKDSCERLKKEANLDVDVQYIEELIDFSCNDISIKKNSNDQILIENNTSKMMSVKIIASNQKMCEKIADVIEKEIISQLESIQKNLGKIGITQISRNYLESNDSELLGEQQACVSRIGNIEANIESLKSSLDSNQQNYYNALINQDYNEEVSDFLEEEKVQYINKKYIIVGLAGGLIFAVIIYLILYILNQYLLVDQEMEDYYGIRVLESFSNRTHQKEGKIDKLINKIFKVNDNFNEAEKLQMVCTNIEIAAEKNDMKRIYLASVSNTEEIENMKQMILKFMEASSLKIVAGNSIITDSESLKEMVCSDGIVLVEQIRKSDFEEIGKEINICKNNDKVIIGSVII